LVFTRPVRGFAYQEQSEGERLSESRRDKRIETLGVVARGFGMSVKHFAEFIADCLQGRVGFLCLGQFGEPVFDDAPHEPRRMGHIASQLFGVIRWRRIGGGERRQGLRRRISTDC
jgi:hypothetical protein